jgi:oligoendopeptidase F
VSDIEYKQEPWRLDDLFSGFDTPKMQRAIEELEKQLQAFEAFRTKLSAELETAAFKEILQAYESLTQEVSRIHGFSGLSFAADTQD